MTPEYAEVVEIVSEIQAVSYYSHPLDSLREILQRRSQDEVLPITAFPYLALFFKQRTPTVEMLVTLRSMRNHYTPERFTEWSRQLSDLYNPVLALLEVHADQPELRYRKLNHRLKELTENIIRSLSPDAMGYHQKLSGLSRDDEMTIALACAQFTNMAEVFPHSPLLVPDHCFGHWKRFIDEETADCLLNHGHSPKVMHNVLSAKSYRSVDEVTRLLHVEVPAMMSGVL
jgi:hypothetical protein